MNNEITVDCKYRRGVRDACIEESREKRILLENRSKRTLDCCNYLREWANEIRSSLLINGRDIMHLAHPPDTWPDSMSNASLPNNSRKSVKNFLSIE